MKFIACAQDPKKQIVMFDMLGQGPANPAADALVPDDRKRFNPVDPANMTKQIALDMAWYADQLRPGAGRIHQDHLGLIWTGSLRAHRSRRRFRSRASRWRSPAAAACADRRRCVAASLALAYARAVPRRRAVERHAAGAGPRPVRRAADRSAGAVGLRAHASASASSSPSSSVVGAYAHRLRLGARHADAAA